MLRGRPLDGHINRILEGKTIETAEKDGRMLILHMTNGERWGIAWTDDNGVGFLGEPCLVKVDVRVMAPSVSIFGAAGL